MLINAQFPIDIAVLEHQDQTLSLAGMTWEDYVEISVSNLLPQLNSQILATFVNRGSNKSSLIIESDFVDSFK